MLRLRKKGKIITNIKQIKKAFFPQMNKIHASQHLATTRPPWHTLWERFLFKKIIKSSRVTKKGVDRNGALALP